MGDIGEPVKHVEMEPLPVEVPAPVEPAVPIQEPVPA